MNMQINIYSVVSHVYIIIIIIILLQQFNTKVQYNTNNNYNEVHACITKIFTIGKYLRLHVLKTC